MYLDIHIPILGEKFKIIGPNGTWKDGVFAHAGSQLIECELPVIFDTKRR